MRLFSLKAVVSIAQRNAKNTFFILQVTVSGDGLIHEVLNGLFDRVDWRDSLKRLPIGVIPGGTGNALSRTLIHEQVKIFFSAKSFVNCESSVNRFDETSPLWHYF